MRPPTRLGGGRGTLPLLSPKQASVPERQTKNPACRRIRPSLSRLCWRDDRTGACTHALNLLGIQSSDFNAPSAAAFGIAVEALLLVIVETSRYSTPSRRRACCRRCDVEVGATDGGRGWRRGLASRCRRGGHRFRLKRRTHRVETFGAVVSLPILPNAQIGDYRAYEVLG